MSQSKPRRRRTSPDDQYRFIMECRSSGLSDQQWCLENGIEPSTFYNWVSRLRQRGITDIPDACRSGEFVPAPAQDVVKLEMISDKPVSTPAQRITTSQMNSSIEISIGAATVRISNDVDLAVLSQVMRYLGGTAC